MAEIPEKDRCPDCGGEGKVTAYWQDSPHSKPHLVGRIKCVACDGSGINPWAEHRHPLAGPLTAADFDRLREAMMRHAFSSWPPYSRPVVTGTHALGRPATVWENLARLGSVPGAHDACRVEDYDQAAEDKALLDGIAAKPQRPDEPCGPDGPGTMY